MTPSCAWCGAPLGERATRLGGRIRCSECGAATTDPWPTDEQLAVAYGEWYRPRSGRRFTFVGDALLRRTRAAQAGRIDAIAPPGPVLDVGAGEGVLVGALARRGREAVGLERGDAPLERLDGEFAAVVFWHSLEHLPAPGAAIRDAARRLRPGGVVAVAVPNTASLQARAFGEHWLHLDPPRHLVHLSAGTLKAGLRRAGLTVEHESHVRGGQIVIGWLDGLVGWLPGDRRLYQTLRAPDARSAPVSGRDRLITLAAAVALLPVAAVCAAVEVVLRRGGTVYVEARRG